LFWNSQWDWKSEEYWKELPDYDKQVLNFFFNYWNHFSRESGYFTEKMREAMADMTDSEKLLFTQKLSLIYATVEKLQHLEIKDERQREELKSAREGKTKLFDK
jgi:hypothetical protein